MVSQQGDWGKVPIIFIYVCIYFYFWNYSLSYVHQYNYIPGEQSKCENSFWWVSEKEKKQPTNNQFINK